MTRQMQWGRSERSSQCPRVAVLADGHESHPALAEIVVQLRSRGVPGYHVEVVAERQLSLNSRLTAGPDLIHICGLAARGVETAVSLADSRAPALVGSVHADLGTETQITAALEQCAAFLSPSRFIDRQLRQAGVGEARIARWEPGVDCERFSPAYYCPEAMPAGGVGGTARINLLFAGRLSAEGGVGLLADAFELARERDPRLHLVLAGAGPEEDALRARLATGATFLGPLANERLAHVLASADLLIHAAVNDAFGLDVLRAQACGLPVLAVEGGGGAELVESGRSGFLVEPSPGALAEAIRWLARRAPLRDRLSTGGLLAARPRSWERSLAQLGAAWSDALADGHAEMARVA